MKQENTEEYIEMIDKEFRLGRLGTPEEVASVVGFVCSTSSSLLNGASILLDGGETQIL